MDNSPQVSDPIRVAGTNDSSILSKRSAERAGYFREDQHLRHFCAKTARRSPLINLGYAIRTTLLDKIVQSFIEDATQRRGDLAIVNLGAGFDPSFFRIEARWRDLLQRRDCRLRWIDVDFPNVIANKLEIIASSPLVDVFAGRWIMQTGRPTWNSTESLAYALVDCDMCDAAHTISRLKALIPDDVPLLCTSEVALVYMPSNASDDMLQAIALAFPSSTYAFLEQLVPFESPRAAFASTMLYHFERRVRTPLRGTMAYPTLEAHRHRLLRSWPDVCVATMLDCWQHFYMKDSSEARRMLTVETFDEWEELDLFLSHYIVGFAGHKAAVLESVLMGNCVPALDGHSHGTRFFSSQPTMCKGRAAHHNVISGQSVSLSFKISRHGHTLTALDDGRLLIFGGYGAPPQAAMGDPKRPLLTQARLSHPMIVSLPDTTSFASVLPLAVTPDTPAPRVRHTTTLVGTAERPFVAVFGGRGNPQTPLADLHFLDAGNLKWRMSETRSSSLETSSTSTTRKPCPRFRHVAAPVADAKGCRNLFVHGGIDKTGQVLSDAWIFDVSAEQWTALDAFGAALGPRHSHAACSLGGQLHVFGGLRDRLSLGKGRIAEDVCISLPSDAPFPVLRLMGRQTGRYALQVVPWSAESILVCGGLDHRGVIPASEQCQVVSVSGDDSLTYVEVPFSMTRCLIDHAMSAVQRHSLVTSRSPLVILTGGGITAFSFGSKVEEEILVFGDAQALPTLPDLAKQEFGNFRDEIPATLPSHVFPGGATSQYSPLPRFITPSTTQWRQILTTARPVVLSGLDIGPAPTLWTPEYLRDRCGHHRVSVHVSQHSPNLKWHDRNFRYEMVDFSEAVRRTLQTDGRTDETVYLRSLSRSGKQPTRLETDFPEIAGDLTIPDELGKEIVPRLFSSPLRLSGPETQMWPHYDTASNILIQIRGRKRVLLWSPSDVDKLYIVGSSSVIPDVLQPDLSRFPLFAYANAFEAILESGDILYIPALWLHATMCLSQEGSTGVNMFFRQHADGVYAKGDIWANQDFQPFTQAERRLDETVTALQQSSLTALEQAFYLKKLGMSLLDKGKQLGDESNRLHGLVL